MAYSELIKNFSRIRAYMRSFYVYGFRHRSEYDEKSARCYDDERRRVESWLQDYMVFRQDAAGRRFFLSVDSRAVPHNPLYRAFRAKSFTDRDIMLHFQLTDILAATGGLPIFDIMEELAERLYDFEEGDCPDESTVRRKLAEYEKLGLIEREKRGRETWYRLRPERVDLDSWAAALDFYAETAPIGVIGDFCRDRLAAHDSPFRFKHHYILNALDGEILCELARTIGEKREIVLGRGGRNETVLPLKIYVSVQSGRQYLLAWAPARQGFAFYRADALDKVKPGGAAAYPEDLEPRLAAFMRGVWGVSHEGHDGLSHLEMTVYAGPDEEHSPRRLEREKRCGTVEQLDDCHWRFSAEVYDALEMLPWIRTFIGRITDLRCDDAAVTERFAGDMASLAALYGGDDDAVS